MSKSCQIDTIKVKCVLLEKKKKEIEIIKKKKERKKWQSSE